MAQKNDSTQTTIEPWLTVQNASRAIDFYKQAFDAVETYRMEDPGGGLVVKLTTNSAGFWLSGGASENGDAPIDKGHDGMIRLILTVSDPDAFFTKAIEAGATEIFPVGEEYGWRLGRIVDPFGFHWEIGHPLS